ncbi:MAG TPA: 4Fe-4S dicluster domain-containing protein [Bacteroidales bacterium]|nr:4Fe-4S dicluster domain-containing protein [Bacteroidales bacterium]HPS73781.1 4Fe-4S dicluster domain-containing protein [Bacteroidales bacterium]
MTLFEQLSTDIRFQEGLKACIGCGVCTAICPAAQFSDYDPRILVDTVQRYDEHLLESLLKGDMIWRCGECLSCKTRCPRGNTPGYIVQALRALSIKTGLFALSEQGRLQLRLKRTVGEHILKYGYCVYLDEVDTDQFPEQGPVWEWFRENRESVLKRLGAHYGEEGAGTLRKISEKSLSDLRAIFRETGGMERYQQIEEGVSKVIGHEKQE